MNKERRTGKAVVKSLERSSSGSGSQEADSDGDLRPKVRQESWEELLPRREGRSPAGQRGTLVEVQPHKSLGPSHRSPEPGMVLRGVLGQSGDPFPTGQSQESGYFVPP